MNNALWVIQAILAIKLISTSYSHGLQRSQLAMKEAVEKMGTSSLFWHTLVAILALITAAGLILPGLTGFFPQLTVWAAILSALMMLSSIYFHVKYRQSPKVFVSVILLAFAVFIAYGRLTLAPF
jgi:putative oxidoreductase